MSIDSTLKERSRYGPFESHSELSQKLKKCMVSHHVTNWEKLPPIIKEALEMIQHKVARILNGDPMYGDNWHDIQGYAKLVEDWINPPITTMPPDLETPIPITTVINVDLAEECICTKFTKSFHGCCVECGGIVI